MEVGSGKRRGAREEREGTRIRKWLEVEGFREQKVE